MTEEPSQKKARSGRHVSTEQKHHLLLFLEDHPDLALPSTPLNPRFSGHDRTRLWGELAGILNAVGPATKDGAGWRRYWAELVALIKKEASFAKDVLTKTGAGKLPGLGDRVLRLIGKEVVEGCRPPLFLSPPGAEQQPSTSRQAAPAIPLGEAIRAPLASPPRRRAPTPDDTLQKIAADQQRVVEAIEGLQSAVLTTAREAAAQREREMKALLEEQQRTTAALNRLAAAAERLIDVVAAMAQTTPGQAAAQEDPE